MSVADVVRQMAPGGARTAPRARYLPIAEHGLTATCTRVGPKLRDPTADHDMRSGG